MTTSPLAGLWSLIGAQQGQGALDRGYQAAQGRFGTDYYDPYTSYGGSSLSMLGNALGLNGQGGSDAARGAFQQGPGYQYQMDQGLEALNRTAASRGMLASGNNSMDLMKYGQGLANQGWNDWLDRLSGGANMGFNAAQGQTARQGTLAGIDMGYGRSSADMWGSMGRQMSDFYGSQPQGSSRDSLMGGIFGGLSLGARVAPSLLSGGGLSGLFRGLL